MHVENDRRNQMQQRVVNPNIRLESYIDSGLCASKNLFHIDTQICLEKGTFSTESVIAYIGSE